MKYVKYKSESIDGDSNVFWVTMSDLLLGLVVVFLILFVFAITGFTQNKVNEQETRYETTEKIAESVGLKLRERRADGLEYSVSGKDDAERFLTALTEAKVFPTKFELREPSLNEIFIEKAGGEI